MKKIIFLILALSAILLVGCNLNESSENNNISGEEIANEQLEHIENDLNVIKSTLNNKQWASENLTVKKTYLSNNFKGQQELTYEILNDDFAIVQTYYHNDEEFGNQIFLIVHKNGNVQVTNLLDIDDYDEIPGNDTFAIDTEKMVLVRFFSHQGIYNYTAYQISNLELKKIESISYSFNDENSENLVNAFNKKYNTHKIETELMSFTDDTLKNLIVDAYNEQLRETHIKLPKINLVSDDAKKVNDEIDSLAKKLKNTINENEGIYVDSTDYSYTIADNILSICIWRTNNINNSVNYYTYNFDKNTKKLLNNIEFIGNEKANKLMENISTIYDKIYEETNTYDEKGSSGYQYYYDINRKLIPNNIDDIQFFCDNEGIKIILKVVAIAGPESHYRIYKLNDYIN